ncbi:MAG: hypothetical protein ACYDAN_16120 [Candidatus Limnocylindrales bacterium]
MSVFPVWQIALDALVASIASLLLLRWRFREISAREALGAALVVGASVLIWRAACNVGVLNDDPIPPISPNDVLAPMATYVLLNVYGAFRNASAWPGWPRAVGWLVAVSFVVNVAVI